MSRIWSALLGLCLLLFSTGAFADDVFVKGYFRNDGVYVQPHYRTAPDGSIWNNYSTQGNTNPYTGEPGTVNPYGSLGGGYDYNYGGSDSNLFGDYGTDYGGSDGSLFGN